MYFYNLLCYKYSFPGWAKIKIYFASLSVSLLFLFIYLSAYIFNPDLIFYTSTYIPFYKKLIPLDILPIIALGVYFYVLLRYDRPNGTFLHSIAFVLLIFILLDLMDNIAYILGITYYGADQFFLFFCLLLLNLFLGLRFAVLHSDKYLLKEQFIFDRNRSGAPPVVDRDPKAYEWFKLIQDILGKKFLTLNGSAASIYVVLAVFTQSTFVTLKLSILIVWIISIYFIIQHIIQRRFEKGRILNKNFLLMKD